MQVFYNIVASFLYMVQKYCIMDVFQKGTVYIMNEKEYNIEIGRRIKEARKSQKITLKELGRGVGISESTTKRYEDGQIKGVDINIVIKFAAALDVSPAWLMGYDDTEKKNGEAGTGGDGAANADEASVLSQYRRLSPEGKQYIHAQLRFRLGDEAEEKEKPDTA